MEVWNQINNHLNTQGLAPWEPIGHFLNNMEARND